MAVSFFSLVALLVTTSATTYAAAPGTPPALRGLSSHHHHRCGVDQFTADSNTTYCGKFEVNSVPVKIKLVLLNATHTNIFGSVYGFDMYCLSSPFLMCADGSLNMDPHHQAEENCLRKQFEGVDEHMSSLTVQYHSREDKVQLISSSMRHVYLEKGHACSTDEYKFTIMQEDGDSITMRRLSVLV